MSRKGVGGCPVCGGGRGLGGAWEGTFFYVGDVCRGWGKEGGCNKCNVNLAY